MKDEEVKKNLTVVNNSFRPRVRPIHYLAGLSWVSVFVMGWLFTLRVIEFSGFAVGWFAFVLVLSVLLGMMGWNS